HLDRGRGHRDSMGLDMGVTGQYLHGTDRYQCKGRPLRARSGQPERTTMTKILYIKSSPRGDASYSTRVGDQAVAELRQAYPDAEIIERDLGREQPFHIDADY